MNILLKNNYVQSVRCQLHVQTTSGYKSIYFKDLQSHINMHNFHSKIMWIDPRGGNFGKNLKIYIFFFL